MNGSDSSSTTEFGSGEPVDGKYEEEKTMAERLAFNSPNYQPPNYQPPYQSYQSSMLTSTTPQTPSPLSNFISRLPPRSTIETVPPPSDLLDSPPFPNVESFYEDLKSPR